MKNFKVEKDYNRVDQFLCQAITGLTKNAARKLCEGKLVTVNTIIAKAGDRLKEGDSLEIKEQSKEAKEEVDIEILFEDKNLIVLNKKRGIPSVSLKSNTKFTVADFLSSYNPCFLVASPEPSEAGLVQRLDNYTSGVIIAAKDRKTWEFLRQQMKEEKITKTYLALVEGKISQQRQKIVAPLLIEKDKKSVKVVNAIIDESKKIFSAESEVYLLDNFKEYSIVRVLGKKMRRHQVRAHLASINHPLVGDSLYGAKTELKELFPEEVGFLLHAESISFKHPVDLKTNLIKCNSPLFHALNHK